jgi:hypothetical protein
MRIVTSVVLALAFMLSSTQVFAQGLTDADKVIMRLRVVCNGGQGGTLLIAFDIKARAGGSPQVVGGYSIIMTFNSTKLNYQGAGQRYQTAYWPGGTWYIDQAFGTSARFNQHTAQNAGGALPLSNQYFTPSANCSNAALGDGFYEVLRYQFQVYPSANGTVNFSVYNLLPYKAGQVFQHGGESTAMYYSSLQNNGNDSLILINNLLIPVDLSSFEATPRGDGSVQLLWRTESESANHGFEIERGDGETFEKIAFVEGKGTTPGATDYEYIDRSATSTRSDKMVFYRLRQIDNDGSAVYSHIVSAQFQAPAFDLGSAYPNPLMSGSSASIPVQLAIPASVDLNVYNALGQRVAVLADRKEMSAGYHDIAWNGLDDRGTALPQGMYFLRFTANTGNGELYSTTRSMSLVR